MRRRLMEVKTYSFLVLAIHFSWLVKDTIFLTFTRKRTLCLVQEAGWNHGSNIQSRRREKIFDPNDICTPDGLSCRIEWEIKQEFRIGEWKKRGGLGHYTNISVQRMHEQRNTLTGHLLIYASISGIPTHRTEIQTAKSTRSVDVCLAAVSVSPAACKTK
jgi:hypothetical protein